MTTKDADHVPLFAALTTYFRCASRVYDIPFKLWSLSRNEDKEFFPLLTRTFLCFSYTLLIFIGHIRDWLLGQNKISVPEDEKVRRETSQARRCRRFID